MINQFEVQMYLEEALPELSPVLHKTTNTPNIYQSVHALVEYTFGQVKNYNTTAVKKCFAIAEKLYSSGNDMVKCAIENVFVYSFSHLPAADPQQKRRILGLIPGTLYTVYMNQVNACCK